MEHKFYKASPKEQRKIQLIIGIVALLIVILFFLLAWFTGIYFIGFLGLFVVLTIVAPFIDVPEAKKRGKFRYHSLLFLSEKPKAGSIQIHGGTLFDYVFVIDRKWNGSKRTNFILQQYLEGLLTLIEALEKQENQNIKIQGTSYIINERTANRLGFREVPTANLQKIILLYNYVNVLITYSISKGKLSFPNVLKTKTYEANLEELLNKKHIIRGLARKLSVSFTS